MEEYKRIPVSEYERLIADHARLNLLEQETHDYAQVTLAHDGECYLVEPAVGVGSGLNLRDAIDEAFAGPDEPLSDPVTASENMHMARKAAREAGR